MTVPTCLNNTSPYPLPPCSVSTRLTSPLLPSPLCLSRPLPPSPPGRLPDPPVDQWTTGYWVVENEAERVE
jgi:hypothetical protein